MVLAPLIVQVKGGISTRLWQEHGEAGLDMGAISKVEDFSPWW